MEEIWKKIDGYEQYEISNQNGWRNVERNIQPKGTIQKGYRYVSLGKADGFCLYHILVAKAFPEICGKWFEGCQVHHINHNSLDNRPENLIVISASEHSKIHYQSKSDSFKKSSEKRSMAISEALKGRRAVEKHKPIIQMSKDGDFICQWDCISDVKDAGYDPSNVCSCCKGKIKTAYGFKWQYAA